MSFLPYGRHSIDDDDIAAVAAVLRGDFLTTGPKVDEFEAAFARATGAEHAVVCNSGTAALHLAVLAQDLGPGDAAVVPTETFLATANVVRMTGAEVVFADVDADSGLLTSEGLQQAIDRARAAKLKPKFALPVHLGGQLCDMAALAAVAKANGMVLIEDACHSLGVPDVGATPHSVAACFSTHPVKAIATAEGGAVTTNDAAAAARMRRLRSHGMVRDAADFQNRDLAFQSNEPNPWYYEMQEIGWNYRIPDVLCALGISQLKKLEGFWRRRMAIAALYDRLLAPLAPVIRPVPHGARPHGWHLYAVLIDFKTLGATRKSVMEWLRARNVGTQVHYIPVHRQPYYRERYGVLDLPGADAYYSRCLSLPMFPLMSDADVAHVADVLAELAAGGVGQKQGSTGR
ncbi:UDP-4-amino-4,6-dideoxy-N-acetyl-beta-L-altrosamine transaminase [Rhodoplanes sp. Z2-YC6860]|uniref:UDP-4-amino-4, 6-dideoxy-N-acetyl-beta-L-altrosamine transaminase n=1 Tax=Rhodoplanes sp. Z2-YC6860 TaxID=674703 RepID=UPI00078C7FE1|nr:UDP-4-amino-4,6-dideoxy-N-acetyl-beta-L-altrosamine transaminase [Rhodoplanes sp. Z2-YC6860]AMN43461.1 4-keto-6-deoxy-N-Acetyl-D-hexosaminyl-(lipid carrier) aminotransferase [Rhodoplanes sp. Z2-YC6860]